MVDCSLHHHLESLVQHGKPLMEDHEVDGFYAAQQGNIDGNAVDGLLRHHDKQIGRCFRGVGLLCSSGVRESEHPSTQSSNVMIMQVLHCPHCQGTDIIRQGTTRQGKQRYRCQENSCKGRTFLLDYTYAGHAAGVKQQIIDMAMNASGIRDTARVLHVSPTTVIKGLKQKRAGVAAGASCGAGGLKSRAGRGGNLALG